MLSQKPKLSQLRRGFHTTDLLPPTAIKNFATADPIKIQEHAQDPAQHVEMASVIISIRIRIHIEMNDVVSVEVAGIIVSGLSHLGLEVETLVHSPLPAAVVDMVNVTDLQVEEEERRT